MTRDEAFNILTTYTKSKNLIKHGIAVESVMKYFAEHNGFDTEYWGNVGLLHDVDYELYPTMHLQKTEELLKKFDVSDDMIRAINSHGYGLCCDVEPIHFMEKVVYTVDELTGLAICCALVNPDKKIRSVTTESVLRKWKKKEFAAGVNREVVEKGAIMLNMKLEDVVTMTLKGLCTAENELGL